MHIFHYFTIYHFSHFLNKELKNWVLLDCFTQNKEEIIFHFSFDEQTNKYLIINCNTSFPFFYLTIQFSKAKTNTTTLFEDAVGLKVLNVQLLEGERVIMLELENHHQIILKLFGKLSNVIHYYYHQVEDIFRHSLQEDYHFELKSKSSFQRFLDYLNNENLQYEELLALPYWDKSFKKWILKAKNSGISAIETAIQLYEMYLSPQFYISKQPLNFSLFKEENLCYEEFTNLNEALSYWVKLYFTEYQYQCLHQSVLQQIENQIKNYEYKVKSNQKTIENIEQSRSYEEIANILMANLHLKVVNQSKYIFEDFYNQNKPIEIALKPEWNLQQNADGYYQKHKKRKIELKKVQTLLIENQLQLNEWQKIKSELLDVKDGKSLQKWLKKYPELMPSESVQKTIHLPYREFVIEGFKIWVGKDAKSNDQLTLHYASKNDIWLHAKDVSGSHVVIKISKNQQVPKHVLQNAAELAGYYSKNRNQSYIPVIYTQRKYVRKGKGLPPGKVILEREDIIFVSPKSYEKIMNNS